MYYMKNSIDKEHSILIGESNTCTQIINLIKPTLDSRDWRRFIMKRMKLFKTNPKGGITKVNSA